MSLYRPYPYRRPMVPLPSVLPRPFKRIDPIRLRYCKRIGRYPLVSVDPGSILRRALFFLFFFFVAFFPPLFFLPLSVQLDGSIPTRSQFYSYPLFLFFPLWLFFPPFFVLL